ncbi:hypothetical protein CROQUDRAFT_699464 [Cronartium quercuum f. sp. fusiforme G11]|uniref:Uncharacterized protein n=1 Tax=Cronartium quercuum f. sp. fusiforme G11 TaxID=708437 RepID=A0A9P6TCX8_9BASI|nr:hypothetical protein CROQUDRAFT_699464 [Cronartium quercuum f. sp. fusiforme G11]
MQKNLAVNHKICINGNQVSQLVHVINLQGVEICYHSCPKQQIFYVSGQPHIWVGDGHNKLKLFGTCIYGFIVAWSKRSPSLQVGLIDNGSRVVDICV